MFNKIRTLVSHTLIYGLGNASTRLIGFLLIPLYTRYLTPVDYGVLALVGMLDQILFIVMNMGQSTAVFRRYFQHEDPAGRDAVLTTSLWLCVMVSLPVGLLGLALSQPLAALLTGAPGYTGWVVIGILAVVFKTLLRQPFAVLRAREESRRYSVYSFARTAVGLVLAITFVVGMNLGGRGVLLSQLFAELALCAVLIPVTLRGIRLRFSVPDAKECLGYGVYLMPSGLLNFMLRLSDRFFLKHYGSLSVVGLYALGYRLGRSSRSRCGLSSSRGRSSSSPTARARTPPLSTPGVHVRSRRSRLPVAGPRPVCRGDRRRHGRARAFREAYRVVPWVAGSFLLEALTTVGNVGMPLNRKVKYRPLILGAVAGLDVGLNFLLIPTYGAMGAAISLFASFLAKFLLEMIVGYRLYPVPYEYGRILRLTLVGAATYGIGAWIARGSLWLSIPVKVLLLLIAPSLLYLTRFFVPEEIARLRGAVGSVRRWSSGLLEAHGGSR